MRRYDAALHDELHIVVEAHDVDEIEGDDEDEEPGQRPADAAPPALERRPPEHDRRQCVELEPAARNVLETPDRASRATPASPARSPERP